MFRNTTPCHGREAVAYLGDDCFWLDDQQSGPPLAPQLCEPNPKDPIGAVQPELSFSIGSLKDQELMPECKNLGMEHRSAAETLPERKKNSERMIANMA